MNVVFVAETSASAVIGGAERVLREQALGLRRRGHQISIVARAPAHDLRSQVPVDDVREQRYVVSRRHESAFMWSSVVRSVQAFDESRASNNPDVVVIHQSLAGLGPILRRRTRSDGWVYVCHSLAHEEYLSRTSAGRTARERARRTLNVWFRLWGERMVIRRCARVIVLSQFMKERVLRVHRVPEHRLRIIPGAADPCRFRPPDEPEQVRRSLGLPSNEVVLFTVRNLVPRMGLENLVHAIKNMGEEARDILVLIGGEGPLRPTLERLIKDLQLTDRVRLLGFVPEEQLPSYYQAADLILVPTLELEGFGLVTVEALACGTPVLGTPVGALPEVLTRVDPRLVAEGSDAASLATAIRRILRRFRDEPGEQERLSVKGRALVESDYNWDRHCEQLEAVLREARTVH